MTDLAMRVAARLSGEFAGKVFSDVNVKQPGALVLAAPMASEV